MSGSRWGATRHPDKQESVTSAKIRLVSLLAGCTDAALAAMTPETLTATHRVPIKDCEYQLIIQRQRRAARG